MALRLPQCMKKLHLARPPCPPPAPLSSSPALSLLTLFHFSLFRSSHRGRAASRSRATRRGYRLRAWSLGQEVVEVARSQLALQDFHFILKELDGLGCLFSGGQGEAGVSKGYREALDAFLVETTRWQGKSFINPASIDFPVRTVSIALTVVGQHRTIFLPF